VLARCAVAAGVDGIFMEVHEDPSKALSDGPNQIPLDQIEHVLTRLLAIHRAAHPES
jgi:2-dehydro-3-deoxyphosphooctonate aldolase (KDO 8-P synthase)